MSVKNSNKNNNNNNNNNNNTSEQDVRYNANMDIAGSFSLLKKQRKVLYLNENNMNHLLNNRHLTTNEKQEVNDKITHSISKHNINKNNNNNNNHSGTAICAGQTYKYTNHPRINATENFHQLIEEIPISHMATTTESNIFTTDIYSDIAINTESTAVNEDEDNDNDNDNDNEKNSSLFAAAFQFSSSNHLAILSRTERSISSLSSSHSFQRSPDSVSSSSSSSSSSRSSSSSSSSSSGSSRGVRSSSSSGSGSGIVRRSSDANGVKSKRLNNSRTQHNNNNKNNLDRNERSTLSHLSGPSRKIQLYIKNRFIQLMPDGTVNGTQDDQSEYRRGEERERKKEEQEQQQPIRMFGIYLEIP
uniref:Uncharacterized protein n=1 Tax=Glossina pallidipes TaxID=7398 RepID=A0A1A9Z898_GLOPL